MYADEAKIWSRVQCGREDGVVGSLASRGVVEGDWSGVWQAVIVDLFPAGAARRDPAGAPLPLAAGVDLMGTRGDIPRDRGPALDRSMASLLGRSPSTVSREVRRNGGYDRYRAALADDRAWARARRPKRCKLATSSRLRWAVARMLGLNWSPEQIAGWLKRAHPGDGSYQVSHETLYRSLFVQARGVLKKELLQHLRSKRTLRRSKQARRKGVGRGQITDMVSIRERPASVEDRAVPGHWEGDLLSGSKNSYIATLVERHTRYVMLATVANKETQTVVSALITQAKKLPAELYKSLGTGARNSRIIDGLAWRPTSMSTSAIHRVRGNVVPTRTPMACSDSTSPREPTCPYTHGLI